MKTKILKRIILIIITAFFFGLSACSQERGDKRIENISLSDYADYRELMRQWVIVLSEKAKSINPHFLIIPQNCAPLFTDTGYSNGAIEYEFLQSIDGTGQEGISYGNDRYNKARDDSSNEQITELLDVAVDNGLVVLSVNYCDGNAADSAEKYDDEHGYISFIASSLLLTGIRDEYIAQENDRDITDINYAENYILMLNPAEYENKEEYTGALSETNYDILIIDAYFYDDIMLSREDVEALKQKMNGGKRIVIAYLSIGEAEDYRYYWEDEYNGSPPPWMLPENPKWEGNYPVKYWEADWQNIIALGEDSYLDKIIEAGFDGVYLDIVDGYETFEELADK